ncbi:MAG TPA: histidine triad nucleotide-binding protein [Gemmatimonadaceae bacterium]
MAENCLFCKIVRGEIPATIVFQNDRVVAFRDIKPEAPTHILIVPREHIPSMNEANDAAMIGDLALTAAQLAKTEGIAESGYRTVMNTNRDAGQTVFHLHMHLLGGRSMAWPPG